MRLIPAIDLYEGQCVRLYQGDFSRKTDYAPGPAELLHRYAEAGAEWVHVVDLSGAQIGRPQHLGLIGRFAASSGSKLQVGGGIRSGTTIAELLEAGVSRVVIGSAAVQAPKDVYAWLERFGADRIALAFDVRVGLDEHPRVYTHGWARTDASLLWNALAPYRALACHVLCTDIGRDGTLGGPNVELYRAAVERFPQFTWQASGGIRSRADLQALTATRVAAGVSGRALLESRMTLEECRPFWRAESSPGSTSATARS